jgi:hypothetical protein
MRPKKAPAQSPVDVAIRCLCHARQPLCTCSHGRTRGERGRLAPCSSEARHVAAAAACFTPSVRPHAVQVAKTDDATAVMKQLKSTPINDMFARNGKIRADGRMVHDMYLVQVKAPGDVKKSGTITTSKRSSPAMRRSSRFQRAGVALRRSDANQNGWPHADIRGRHSPGGRGVPKLTIQWAGLDAVLPVST